jgi:hypothetical protein
MLIKKDDANKERIELLKIKANRLISGRQYPR